MFQTLNLGTVAWLGWAGPLVADIVPVGRGRFQLRDGGWRGPFGGNRVSHHPLPGRGVWCRCSGCCGGGDTKQATAAPGDGMVLAG